MILRKLSLFGFKSFAEKTELEFGTGMTAVVGPNGCGKSNVVDAIRWVLGEQRVSLLRSAAMQDVIFSGTQSRQPLNMAEVVLTIENTRGVLPVEYNEVAISRRIFRSGESEYRINRVPCRLRDIHNLFLDTGVGSSAYTTIERAMIDSILSDKAEERRILFEEAAGIGKYKQRRKESLRELDRTKQDLLRINDQVQEVDRSVRMLARHVERAQRYKTYRDDLKNLELGYWSGKFAALGAVLGERRRRLDEMGNRRELQRASLASQESHLEKKRLGALEKEKELEAASRNVGETHEKIIRLDRDLSVAQERIKNLQENIGSIENDIRAIAAHMDQNSGLHTRIEQSIIERETELEQCGRRLKAMQADLAQFDGELQAKREEADRLSREQIELINAVGDTRNEVSAQKSLLAGFLEQRERAGRELHALEVKAEDCREAIAKSRAQLATADEENRNLLQSRDALLARVDGEDKRYRELVEREKKCEAQIESAQEQLKFLEGLDAAFEGYESGVKELLTRRTEGVRGIVADLIRVNDADAAALVEKVLGPAVQAVVFDTEENLAAAMRFLRKEKVGSARMVALDRLAAVRSARLPDNSWVALRSLLQPAAGYEALCEHLLDGVVVADSGEQALTLSRQQPGAATFVARDGVICREDGTVSAGEAKKQQAGILQRRLQIEQLCAAIERARKEHAAAVNDRDVCIINRDEARKALVEVDEKLNKSHRLTQEQQTNIRHYENEQQAVSDKMVAVAADLSGLGGRIAFAEEAITRGEAAMAEQQTRYEALEAQVESVRGIVRAMEDERRGRVEHAKNVELEEQGLTSRIGQDRQDAERLTKENARSFERKQQKSDERQNALTEAAALEETMETHRRDQATLIERRAGLVSVRDAVREEYNNRLSEINELEKGIKAGRVELETAAEEIHAAELEVERDEQEQRRIRERMWESYETDLSSPQEPLAPVEMEEPAVLEKIDMLRERMKRIGEVNMAAFADYETESKRLAELTTQRDDLQKAVESLEQAIRKLDKEARAQFIATFGLVQNHFGDMFTTLFEGGDASLSLDENADPLEAAIHINVRPAGKKMRPVHMLSAGERALTAISLLFALYLVKPSAYCILDELDAPLDEANTVRFLKVLRRFAGNTQFIVITHNKRTMEAADVLYGITQRESGVSSIVSVKFEEALRQAA